MKNKNISEEDLKSFIETHMINYELLKNNNFEAFFNNRAKSILNKIEKATGKEITDRSSENVINYFGEKLV